MFVVGCNLVQDGQHVAWLSIQHRWVQHFQFEHGLPMVPDMRAVHLVARIGRNEVVEVLVEVVVLVEVGVVVVEFVRSAEK